MKTRSFFTIADYRKKILILFHLVRLRLVFIYIALHRSRRVSYLNDYLIAEDLFGLLSTVEIHQAIVLLACIYIHLTIIIVVSTAREFNETHSISPGLLYYIILYYIYCNINSRIKVKFVSETRESLLDCKYTINVDFYYYYFFTRCVLTNNKWLYIQNVN